MRLFRLMIATVAFAVIASAVLAPWRVTLGLMLGGLLSLFNYHWVRTSIAAVFNVGPTQRPRVGISLHILRSLVVGVARFAASHLHVLSLPAPFPCLLYSFPALFL